jgi:hypothetical protein
MDRQLIPYAVTDPQVPVVPHRANPQPTQAELEVRNHCVRERGITVLIGDSEASPLGGEDI